jgi:DNA repair exonuclease SbcCD ATPase subunit
MNWTPEDEKRLAGIREFSGDDWRISQRDVRWLLAKLDESKRRYRAVLSYNAAERKQRFEAVASYSARLAEEQTLKRDLERRLADSARARAEAEEITTEALTKFAEQASRLERAEAALAEERAKREAAEARFEKDREALIRHHEEYRDSMTRDFWAFSQRAENAEASREAADNDMCEEAGKRAAAEVRAETAEARVAEIENACQCAGQSSCVVAGTPVERVPEMLAARVAELEAATSTLETALRKAQDHIARMSTR